MFQICCWFSDVDSDWAAVSDASHQQPSKGVSSCSADSNAAHQPCICQQQVRVSTSCIIKYSYAFYT